MGLKHDLAAGALQILCPQQLPRQLMAGARLQTMVMLWGQRRAKGGLQK